MHKSIARVIGGVIFVTLLCSGVAYAFDVVPSQDDNQTVKLITEEMVYIAVGDSVEFDLTSPGSFDGTWPKYFGQTYPEGTPTCTLAYWTNCHDGATVQVQANKAHSDEQENQTVDIGQLFYAPIGTDRNSNGDEDPIGDGWKAFDNEAPTAVDASTAPGLVQANQEYEFQWQHDDEPCAGKKVILTYTVTAKN